MLPPYHPAPHILPTYVTTSHYNYWFLNLYNKQGFGRINYNNKINVSTVFFYKFLLTGGVVSVGLVHLDVVGHE